MSGIPSPLFGAFVAAMLVVIALSIFAWRWAVRKPADDIMTNKLSQNQRSFVYAAIGASDVVGVGADNPATDSWVNVVYEHMPLGTRFVRLGRSGITLREANTLEVPKAVSARPDIVTIWDCVNDAVRITPLDQYSADLRKALNALTKGTGANILVLNLPDLSLLVQYSAYSAQRDLVRAGVQKWNAAIEQTVRAYDERVKVLDLFDVSHEALAHPEYISRDNFHPSTEGYRRLGDLVWAALEAYGWVPVAAPLEERGQESA